MTYFSIHELTRSATAQRLGIDNTPTAAVKKNLEALVKYILDPLRKEYGKPIIVTSGYRCPRLNKLVGGSATSQHVFGQAADIRCVSGDLSGNKRLFDLIMDYELPFDQLIWEYGDRNTGPSWVHVSFGPRHRRQVLYIR